MGMSRACSESAPVRPGVIDLSTKSLFLVSAAYIVVGVVAGGLLANTAVLSSAPAKIQEAASTVARTVSNTDAKHDRLVMPVNFSARGAGNPAAVADTPVTTGSLPPSTLSAYAALPPAANEKIGPPIPWAGQPQPAKPKQAAAKHPPAASAILSDEQIASVRERMNLTPYQAQYWPAIEAALRKIAPKLNRNKGGADVTAASIDPDSPEVQDLKSAAMPLLFTLSEDQKREVRTLARVIGLDAVASAI
jgi:hypothetical protein